MTTEQEREHEKEIAEISAKKEAFINAPITYALCKVFSTIINVIFWLGFWGIIAQCSCKCIINK